MSSLSKTVALLDEVGFPEPPPDAFGGYGAFGAEWEEPIPFTTITTPNFPTESLPHEVAAYVEALAESTQTPDEMGASLSLGVLSTAFQSRYEVEITSDWREQLSLYLADIAPPGERKSAVLSGLCEPVYHYESARRESENADIEQSKTEKDILIKSLEAEKNRAAKAKTSTERDRARIEAMAISEQLADFREKHHYRLLVDDTTTEKLIDIMDAQGGCITVASAEGGVFDTMAGRYDKSANFDVYLKGHSGDPITVDRIGRKPNHIKKPKTTMLLTIQPEVLNGLMDNSTFRGRGLCGRFLYTMCRSKVGSRNATPEPIPPQVKERYRQFVQHILSGQDTGTIYLSKDARSAQVQYQNAIEKRLVNEWDHMKDWGGKLVGAMIRIAALIHAAESSGPPTETPISEETLIAAIKIAEFFGAHAMAAYQAMGADETHEDAKYLWKRIRSTGQERIARRDLWHICKGKFKKVETMTPALNTLIEMGYIREIEESTGGRPSIKIIINPLTKSTNSTKRV